MTLLMGLVAIGAEPAAAQRTGTFEVGAMGQFTRLDADVQLGDSSFGLGGRIGFFPLRHVAVEAEYGFGTLQDNPRNASTWLPFRAMMVLNLPITAGVKLLAGAGYKGERWHGDTTYNQIEDAYTFLGGLRVCLDGGWSLRPEVVLDHNGYSNNQGVGDNSNYVGFRFGVSRFLGRGSRTCASAPPPPPSPQAVAVTPASVSPPTPTSPTPSPVAPAPAPAPAPPPPPRELFRLDGVYFAFDRAEIRPEGLRLLDSAVATLDQNGTLRVEIQGHTDPVGSDAYNQDLSLRRANAVREYLVSRGIAASRMTTRGFGEDQPIADNATSDGRAQNRRVVVIEVPN